MSDIGRRRPLRPDSTEALHLGQRLSHGEPTIFTRAGKGPQGRGLRTFVNIRARPRRWAWHGVGRSSSWGGAKAMEETSTAFPTELKRASAATAQWPSRPRSLGVMAETSRRASAGSLSRPQQRYCGRRFRHVTKTPPEVWEYSQTGNEAAFPTPVARWERRCWRLARTANV